MRKLRIVLADDHLLLRLGLASFLGEWDGAATVWEAEDAIQVVTLCRDHRPDVVLLDLELPPASGLEALRAIRLEMPDVTVVMLAGRSGDAGLSESLAAGADGVYVKEHNPSELFHLLQEFPWT